MASHKIKTIFFWILVATFCLIAPVIVFYAIGYRFSPERGVFVYSGSITLKPTPREIEVLIDNKSVAKGVINFINYSYHIDGLAPGEYLLEIKAPNYKSWSKKISVHSGVSTEFWNIFLARENYTKMEYPSDFIKNFFLSPDSKKVAMVAGESDTVVKILDIKKEEVEYVFPIADYVFFNDTKENVEWSPREGYLSVPMEREGKREYYIVNIGSEKVINLNNFLRKDNIRQVRWSSVEKGTIFYIYDDNLYKVDLNDDKGEILIVENVAGYDISADGIYYFDKSSGLIYEKNSRGTNNSKQVSFSSIDAGFGTEFRLIAYDKDRIAVITQDKALYLFNKSDENADAEKINKLGDSILGVHFSNDGKKMLFWNNNEAFVYFVRKWETQPDREEGQSINVIHFSSEIENVSWFRDYEHIIFSVGDTIKIAELDHRSSRNIHDIFKLNKNKLKVTYTTRDDNVFFIDSKDNADNNLFSISLEEENLK